MKLFAKDKPGDIWDEAVAGPLGDIEAAFVAAEPAEDAEGVALPEAEFELAEGLEGR